MKYRHIGVRPSGELKRVQDSTKVWREDLGDEGYRLWNAKTLNSGCGKVLDKYKVVGHLIYCKFCGELANINQFVEVDECEFNE